MGVGVVIVGVDDGIPGVVIAAIVVVVVTYGIVGACLHWKGKYSLVQYHFIGNFSPFKFTVVNSLKVTYNKEFV
jgi:hypothetical protein